MTERAGSLEAAAGGDRFWPLLFGGYFLFQAFWRWRIGGALGLDEAQMMLNGQRLAWGYGSQPPLYGWLQWAAFQVIPDPLLAMALLKNALLAGTFLAVYRLLRSAHPPRVAGLATLSLMLLPQIAWESQRALTHSVLATTLAAVATLVFWTRVLPRRRGADLLFGVVIGLGLIAKANFVFVAPALWLAAASLADLRVRLRLAGVAVSLAVAAAICAGPLVWVVQHPDLALASADKLQLGRELPAAAAAGRGWSPSRWRWAGSWRCRRWCSRCSAGASGGRAWRRRRRCSSGSWCASWRSGWRWRCWRCWARGPPTPGTGGCSRCCCFSAPVATLWLMPRLTDSGARWLGGVAAGLAVLAAAALPFALVSGRRARRRGARRRWRRWPRRSQRAIRRRG